MRRITFALVASALLLAFAPAGALAKSHNHPKKHLRGAHRAHMRRFGDMSTTAPTTTTGSPAPVGNVFSFDTSTNTLVVHFDDGNTVTGVVTNDTEIECTSGASSAGSGSDDQSDQSGTSGSDQSTGSDDQGGDDQAGDDQGGDDGSSSACGTASLQKNAPVLGAEVSFGTTTKWEKIQLG